MRDDTEKLIDRAIQVDRDKRRQWAEENNRQREQVVRLYTQGLKAGVPEDKIRADIRDKTGLSDKQIENRITRVIQGMSPHAQAITETIITQQFHQVLAAVQAQMDFVDDYISEIKNAPEIYVKMEKSTVSGKTETETVKFVPKNEAILRLLKEQTVATCKAIDSLKALRPDTVVNINQNKGLRDIPDSELAAAEALAKGNLNQGGSIN